MSPAPRRVSIVLFEGFELLDAVGPLELFSRFPDALKVALLGPAAGPVRSGQGAAIVATESYDDTVAPDIVLVPGGPGTRSLARDEQFLGWLRSWAGDATVLSSVCTGSALLAAAGLLDGYRATSNKRAFAWASAQSDLVDWAPRARWVVDRNRWTSSGVAAGMDMAAALLAELFGVDASAEAASAIELELHTDPDWDPFAAENGLG